MKTIKANSSSSMYRASYLALGILIVSLVLSTTAFACGISYRNWYHISQPMPFDPLNLKASDSTFLFRQFFPQRENRRSWYDRRKEEQQTTYTAIESRLSQKRPSVGFLAPHKIQEFRRNYCFIVKYKDLRDDSISLAKFIKKRMRIADYEKAHSGAYPPRNYYPEYDRIADPSALKYLADIRTNLASDKYSGYFSTVINSIARCYERKNNSFHWPSAEKLLVHMQGIPEYELAATMGLLMGYVGNGSIDRAEKMLAIISSKLGGIAPALGLPFSSTVDEEMQSLISQYEIVLNDEAVMVHRPIFRLEYPSDSYAWGSCKSNTLASVREFSVAVADAVSLSDTEIKDLLAYRVRLLQSCPNKSELTAFLQTIQTDQKSPYHAYLLATSYFYLRDYIKAIELFSQLAEQAVPWVAETSLYLSARSQMLASQAKWRGYRRDESIDKPLALQSAKTFLRYVTEYPEGRYVASASGLVRRAHWLSGDQPTYRNMLMEAKQDFLKQTEISSTWTEMERAKLEALFREYKLTGEFDDESNNLSIIEAFVDNPPDSTLEKFSPFSRSKEMIDAYKAFLNSDYGFVIDRFADKADLNRAELLLLARSYEKSDRVDDALEVWRSALPAAGMPTPTSIFEMSKILLQNYGVGRVVKDEEISDIHIKRVYLASLCDDDLQKQLLAEQSLPGNVNHAIFVDLAQRYLFAGEFQKLHQLMKAHPDSLVGEYSAIRTAVRQIANQESLGKAYMNIAYFLQAKVHNPIYALASFLEPPKISKCRQNTLAAGARGPYYYFNLSLRNFDENSHSIAEQKSLYYLTICFKRGVASRSCLWGDRPRNGLSSKEAFTRLHAKYKSGKWVDKAKHYY